MVWNGEIIDPRRIPAKYADFNSTHPYCIRQNNESFVLYTSHDDPGTAYHAANFQMAIRHNHRLHVDFDVKFNPVLYTTIAQHMNVYKDPPRWAIYLPDNNITLWPENSIEMPTLQEFMVRDTDIYPHATIPVGKKKCGERTLKHSGEVEGKLSAEQRAKVASKQKLVKDDYEKRRAAKEAEAANPLGEDPSSSSAVNGDTNMET
ncbi:hypothetical protein B0H14DRAFT_2579513 [Mycena olivaceomarginata]|nr:hypothetical protein B0H14DRAFT_2579513 [Mycena olivaceomarginata]